MRSLFFGILLIIVTAKSTAQVFSLTKKAGGVNYDVGTSIVVDKADNIYAIGYFEGICWFDSMFVESIGGFDIYIVKYQQNGTVEWVKSFGGGIDDYPGGICIDSSDNIYVCGDYQLSIDFGDTILNGEGGGEAFVAKFDRDGNFIWARQFSGTGSDYGSDVKFQNNYIYFAGAFSNIVRFDASNILISKGQHDIFLTKLDTAGNLIWVRQAGGKGDNFTRAIATDASGNIYATGSFKDSCSFYTNKLRSNGGLDIFIAKYTASGVEQWVKQIGGDYDDYGTGIAATPSGDIYIIGSIKGYVIVGSSAFNGLGEAMVAKFDNSANFQWLKQGDVRVNGIAVDNMGDAYIVGYYRGTSNFDNDTIYENDKYSDKGFVARFSKNGNFRWIAHSTSKGDCWPASIYPDNDGTLYITGRFDLTTTFGKDSITSLGIWDIFITELIDYEHTGLNETGSLENIMIYPNPANHYISLMVPDFLHGKLNLTILNSTGKLVYNETINKKEATIDIEQFATGIYLIVLQTTNGTIAKRIVKR